MSEEINHFKRIYETKWVECPECGKEISEAFIKWHMKFSHGVFILNKEKQEMKINDGNCLYCGNILRFNAKTRSFECDVCDE